MNQIIKNLTIYTVLLFAFMMNNNSSVFAQTTKAKETKTNVQLIAEKEKAVVKIRQHKGFWGEDTDLGTGFFIEQSGIVVTNNHVVKERGSDDLVDFFVQTIDGKIYERDSIIGYNAVADVFVFSIKNLENVSFPFLSVIYENSSKGEDIFLIGHPADFNWLYSPGFITGYYNDKDSLNDYVFDAEIMPGSSGSPVFNSKGDVIGITKATYGYTGNFNLATRSSFFTKLNPYSIPDKNDIVENWLNDETSEKNDDQQARYYYDYDNDDSMDNGYTLDNSSSGYALYEYLFQGKNRELDEKYYAALYYYKKAIQISSADESLFLKVSKLYFKTGDYQNAINAANQALSINPVSLDAMNIIGKSWFELREYKKSKKIFKKVFKNDLQNETALHYTGKLQAIKQK